MSKKRILFVDDDPHVLAGLRNLMHRERTRWESVFVDGGDAALARLAEAPFDLVVSDMRMPGMDGVQLLERVRQHWPATVRVMLSGSADAEEVARASAAVDELIGKPCSAATLKATLERMLARAVMV
jgi:CheY-like chemotaxis protein